MTHSEPSVSPTEASQARQRGEAIAMQPAMLYDSDQFVVVHVPYGGFELVRKPADPRGTALSVFLTGPFAQAFQSRIQAWQLNTPTQDEVENEIDAFTQLGTVPLLMQ